MNLAEIAVLLGVTLGLILAAMLGLWALALRSGRPGFVDGVWPLGMAALAAITFVATEGDPVRKGLLLWLVALWALPQAWRRLTPAARREADARYARVTEALAARRGWKRSRIWLLLFFLPQGALAWLTALPVQLGQVDFTPPVGWIGWTGAVVAVLGIGLEGFGSLRTAVHRNTPAPGPAPSTGPGRWLRRPDYLGDLAVWWGLCLIASETGPGRWSVLGPLFLTFAMAHWATTENPRRVSNGG
jgi:steroid 5-alpha reductase family enzyme